MTTLVQFGGQDRHYQLKQALLIYQDAAGAAAASVHDVELANGRPNILAGHPITVTAVEHLIHSLGRGAKPGGFISPNIISLAMDGMAWWCPAARRRIWFKASFSEGEERKRLKLLNGKLAHHPPLLFKVEGRALHVYALAMPGRGSAQRPTPRTRLYRAPYWNLSEGHMCNGDLKLPPVAPENIAAFETAFFGSAFTHSNAGNLTRFTGGHTAFWEHLAARKRAPDAKFWTANLIRGSKSVADILK